MIYFKQTCISNRPTGIYEFLREKNAHKFSDLKKTTVCIIKVILQRAYRCLRKRKGDILV